MKCYPPVVLGKRALVIVLLITFFLSGSAQAADAGYPVKVGFLFNFAQFIDWPSGSFSNAESPFVVGVYGDNPFGDSIFLLEQKRIHNRPVKVQIIPEGLRTLPDCHMLFIPVSQKEHALEVVGLVGHRPIVLVGEFSNFADDGGMINLYMENDRIAFEVNRGAIYASHLDMSSRLLRLARVVGGEGQP